AYGRPSEAQLTLTRDELRKLVAEQRTKGWRPERIAAYRDGEQLRYTVVFVENWENADWDFAEDLTTMAYEKALAEHKERGMRPLTVAPYEEMGQTRYTAVWLRYKPEKKN